MNGSYQTSTEYNVMPNRWSLLLGLVVTGFFFFGFLGPGWRRLVAAFLAFAFLTCLFNLIWPKPIVRAAQDGLYLGIGTLGRSFFYVPWDRVDAVVLTEVIPLNSENGLHRKALGFVIRQDDQFKLPGVKWNVAGDDVGDVHSDIRFDCSILEGDVATWVQTLEGFRKNMRGLPA
jgi:hypothetical protein